MGSVIDPFAGRRDPFASRDGRRVPDKGDHVPMTARLHPQDAKAVLRVVERDPLDRAGEDFAG